MKCHFCNIEVTIPCEAKEAETCPNLFPKKERKLIPLKEYEKRKDDNNGKVIKHP
jgi:hypothetical protein